MIAKSDKSPALGPSTTPTLKSKNYTTGRGGTGNIVKNDDPETARKAQDIDVPGITLPENEYHTGRGELQPSRTKMRKLTRLQVVLVTCINPPERSLLRIARTTNR